MANAPHTRGFASADLAGDAHLSPIRRAEIAADKAMRVGIAERMNIELARQDRERRGR